MIKNNCWQIPFLQDLAQYKYEKMVCKSLDILNKLYSSRSDMFSLAVEAQVCSDVLF